MARSDWCAALWNSDGSPVTDLCHLGGERFVGISKGGIHIDDSVVWPSIKESNSYRNPIIRMLYPDDLGNHDIFGTRIMLGTNDRALFFVAGHMDGEQLKLAGGVSCYGWMDTFDDFDVAMKMFGHPAVKDPEELMSARGSGTNVVYGPYGIMTWFRGKDRMSETPRNYEYLGMRKGDLEAFGAWLPNAVAAVLKAIGRNFDEGVHGWMSAVQKNLMFSYNQGDCFIQEALGVEVEITEHTEKPSMPIMMQMISPHYAVARKPPHRSVADRLDERVLWFRKLQESPPRDLPMLKRPGLSRRAAPAAWRRLETHPRWKPWAHDVNKDHKAFLPPSVKMQRMKNRAKLKKELSKV